MVVLENAISHYPKSKLLKEINYQIWLDEE